jgi:copper chaperone CopZ
MTTLRLLIAAVLVSIPSQAEFRRIQYTVAGMDCVSCVDSLTKRLKRIRGVDSAELNVQKGTAVLELARGNAVKLDLIRDEIKGAGFTPREARVVVRGKAVTADGRWRFEVEGSGQVYGLSAARNELIAVLQQKSGHAVTIDAVAAVPSDPHSMPTLEATAVRAEE